MTVKEVRDKMVKLGGLSNKILRKEKQLNVYISKHNRAAKELNRINAKIAKIINDIETLKNDKKKELGN